jgi:hypothetical protein
LQQQQQQTGAEIEPQQQQQQYSTAGSSPQQPASINRAASAAAAGVLAGNNAADSAVRSSVCDSSSGWDLSKLTRLVVRLDRVLIDDTSALKPAGSAVVLFEVWPEQISLQVGAQSDIG